MKSLIFASFLLLLLTACEDASEKVDEAQQAANEALEKVQNSIDSFDIEDLNLERFDEAYQQARELALSIRDSLDENLNDPEAFNKIQDDIQNAYSCLVDATSESKAEQFVNKILDTINDDQATTLIERAMQKAKDAKQCIL